MILVLKSKHSLSSKQCLFAPLIEFQEYLKDLELAGYDNEKLGQFCKAVKAQLVSNLFYLPMIQKEEKEYVVFLDNIFWFPASELNAYMERIQENRMASLSHFGYYLFILKLSYHLCRLPEQCDRESNL